MDRRTLIAYITVIAMLSATILALKGGVDIMIEDQPGVHMRMPVASEGWQGKQLHYCHSEECHWSGSADEVANGACPRCSAPTFPMAWVEKEQLPPDTEFVKYLYTDSLNRGLLVSMVLSGSDRNSIHRPQRCLAAQGYGMLHSRILQVHLSGRGPLTVEVLEAIRPDPRQPDRTGLKPRWFAYWFVGQDRETPSHLTRMFWLAWDRIFRGVAHRWVYIMIQGQGYRSREAFANALETFIPAWYPTVLR
ncbi:MAG: exosortase-associated EpsI family protein [Kiritimatiellae bacterium]|nr:exosortase-associated EpsI family protein [Kiritimatiellia bacterium]